MDTAIRDTLFIGLSLCDIAEALVLELRRRHCYGVFYAIPAGTDLYGTFTAAIPPGTVYEMTPEQILSVFAEAAAIDTEENRVIIPGEASPNARKPN